ncbi:unnamed protein product, partial [Sphenostylis stenocarpa]
PEANHGESVTPSNDAQIAPLHRLSFQMSILLKLAQVSDTIGIGARVEWKKAVLIFSSNR